MCIFWVYKIAIWPLKCVGCNHLGPLRFFVHQRDDWAIPGSEYITCTKIITDFFWCMKIGTNRNLEDPTGFGTSPGFCSTTQRMYGILFNFCPNKAVFFSGFPFLHSCYWRLQFRRNGLGPWEGWEGFGWWQQELGNFNKNVDVSTVEFLQLGWWISHLLDKLYWPFFSEGTCNFRTITRRESLLHRSVHADLGVGSKKECLRPEFSCECIQETKS